MENSLVSFGDYMTERDSKKQYDAKNSFLPEFNKQIN